MRATNGNKAWNLQKGPGAAEHGWCITSKQYRPVTDFDGSGGLAPLPTRNSIVICKISPAKIALFHPNQTLHSIAFTLPYASLGSASILSLVPWVPTDPVVEGFRALSYCSSTCEGDTESLSLPLALE
ncbi:hypothetical protein CBS63078_3662 [Aspergillus niger]|nr:hypothetical protein CBS115989_4786 [Aspergillus niger]KAI2820284.1 hypothetical protein CBS133816_9847 [Aspergillus niger]KAI2835215.1 hypothetical protein CBS11350_10193 [Aspergillus niger]KAI2859180.1 hypothetical protein CBS11232_2067 [Aspergillus niger]KAI2864692.1 hypothetical protein CBS12448_2619 [Aspergillus niger]